MISLSNRQKRYTLLCLLCIFELALKGQNVAYYALTKKYFRNGAISSNVTGGQFVSFIDNICYESNNKGIGVGHGTLKLKNGNSNYKLYVGSSYWGANTIFKFKSDLSILNVVLENGNVYVYRRQAAPPSATTCSLIRKKGSSIGNANSGGAVYAPSYPNYGNNGSNAPNPSRGQNNSSTRRQPTKHTCNLCKGQRRIVKDTYTSLYGQSDYQVKCNECGGYFMRSTGHTHITCPQCHGRGYFTTD